MSSTNVDDQPFQEFTMSVASGSFGEALGGMLELRLFPVSACEI